MAECETMTKSESLKNPFPLLNRSLKAVNILCLPSRDVLVRVHYLSVIVKKWAGLKAPKPDASEAK